MRLLNDSSKLKKDVKLNSDMVEVVVGRRGHDVWISYSRPLQSNHSASFELEPEKARDMARLLNEFADDLEKTPWVN